MAEHTPTTSDVRARYTDSRAGIGEWTRWDESVGREVEAADAEFDRWLAEVRRETWDEVADYLDRTNAPSVAEATRRDNPYRKDETDD